MKIPLNNIPTYLLQDALDSLNEGLYKYKEGINGKSKSFKFAILHISRFVELMCKFIIAERNPILIYKNAFNETPLKDQKTISFNEALNFIQNIHNDTLDSASKTFSEDIKILKNTRNKITHHFIHVEEAEAASDILGQLIDAMYYLLYQDKEKDIIAQGVLPENKEIFDQLVDTFRAKLELADKNAHILSNGEPIFFCTDCGNKTFLLQEDEYICTFCHYKEKTYSCSLEWCCGGMLIRESQAIPWDEEYNSFVCEDCYDAFDDKANSN